MSTEDEAAAAAFEPHRRYLVAVAYRMLGSVAEAEDIVQDAFLRWQRADRSTVEDVRPYLAQVVTRLSLDKLKSARARRENYVGTWLPEPIVEDAGATTSSSEGVAHDVSLALMMTLERLSPLERAAFLLHDVFDMDYGEIAGALERSEAAVRQLATRAREHIREQRPRFRPTPESESRLAGAFGTALATGNLQHLTSLLAEDAVLYSDGGGKRRAALNPIFGRDRILRFFEGIATKHDPVEATRPARINGLPGYMMLVDGVWETMALEISGDQVVRLYIVRNPDKLRHVS
ncbi:MAG: sigma-70 family RNA polymerase sigma factor [Kofleriaceae bacterium]|nr:sigma-70 family RNA polymerase sigma factor [Kofleriaceae bacterium]